MAIPVLMPRQGQSVETCIIGEWYKKKGDSVKVGDILFSYETDKASFEEEAKADGILLDVFFAEGDEVPVLVNVAVIGAAGESVEEFRPGGQAAPVTELVEVAETKAEIVVTPEVKTIAEPSGKVKISPRAKSRCPTRGCGSCRWGTTVRLTPSWRMPRNVLPKPCQHACGSTARSM